MEKDELNVRFKKLNQIKAEQGSEWQNGFTRKVNLGHSGFCTEFLKTQKEKAPHMSTMIEQEELSPLWIQGSGWNTVMIIQKSEETKDVILINKKSIPALIQALKKEIGQ